MVKKLCLALAFLSLVSSDCLDSCPVHKLQDGQCDDECNTYECSFDGSDCIKYCECEVSLIGDGLCNQECYDQKCSWDYGDCEQECFGTQCDLSQLGDGICNQECNNLECQFDRKDCDYEKSVEESHALSDKSSNFPNLQYRHSSRLLSSGSDDPFLVIYITIPISVVLMVVVIALRIYRIRAYNRAMAARAPRLQGITIVNPTGPQVVYNGAPNQGIQMQPQPIYGTIPVNNPMAYPNQQFQNMPQPAYVGMPSAGPGVMYNQYPAYPNQGGALPTYENAQGYPQKSVNDTTMHS